MSPILECHGVSVRYGRVEAISEFDLDLSEGETVALLGPSGSGKSTILYSIAGFTPLSSGSISLSGTEVSRVDHMAPPEERSIALVFQNYALWPHLSAGENVAFPLKRSGLARREALAEARALLEKVGIADLSDRRPAELSGGEQQRVGLARALARSAGLYLFDEPTAHLDSPVRAAIAEEIRSRRDELGAAAIYATHDSEEALAIADRVVVLREGRTLQTGTPIEIYEKPVDEWSARLTGPVSTIRAEPKSGTEVSTGDSSFRVDSAPGRPTGTVRVLIRPEWLSPGGPIRGKVDSVAFRGPHTDYSIITRHGVLVARIPGAPRIAEGEASSWTINRGWVLSESGPE